MKKILEGFYILTLNNWKDVIVQSDWKSVDLMEQNKEIVCYKPLEYETVKFE